MVFDCPLAEPRKKNRATSIRSIFVEKRRPMYYFWFPSRLIAMFFIVFRQRKTSNFPCWKLIGTIVLLNFLTLPYSGIAAVCGH